NPLLHSQACETTGTFQVTVAFRPDLLHVEVLDGGALAPRIYIHQLPQAAPRVAGLIEGVFGPAASAERHPAPQACLTSYAATTLSQHRGYVAGTGFEPV
ncbi:MAG TPA: hypothetical protein VHM23_26690, partial [Actinomycetota bacterium]|nr:hypothetical protein [Actinomycetota bacterium]